MNKEFLSIVCDGNDGSGKNTATITILELLLKNFPEKRIVFTNFPQYFLPIGFLIRRMNRGLGDKYVAKYGLSVEEELRLRASMYSLDRIFAWCVLKKYLDKNTIHLSDRLSLAQVNTWGYVLSQRESVENPFELLEIALNSDEELNSFLNPYTILFSNYGIENAVKVNREYLDDYEKMEAVQLAEEGYVKSKSIYEEKGKNIYVVQTKTSNAEWKNRYAIAKEVLDNVGLVVSEDGVEDFEIFKSKNLIVIGPNEYLKAFCPNYDISKTNLNEEIDNWLKYSLFPEEEGEGSEKPKKQLLDEVESNIALKLDEIFCSEIESFETYLDEELKDSIKRLHKNYTSNRMIDFIEFVEKESGVSNFISNFVRKIVEG